MRLRFARCKITGTRIIILALNLLAGAGVVVYAGYSYQRSSERKETTKLVRIDDFKPLPAPVRAPAIENPHLDEVALWLCPISKAGAGCEDNRIEGHFLPPLEPEEGPLGKHWEFGGYFLREDPERNRAMLRCKQGAPEIRGPVAPAAGRTQHFETSRPRGGKAAASLPPPRRASQAVWLQASDGTCTAPDPTGGSEDVTFRVDSVSDKELIYSLPDKPETQYRMPFQPRSRYIESGRLLPLNSDD